MIDNPFSILERRLNRIESLILEVRDISANQFAQISPKTNLLKPKNSTTADRVTFDLKPKNKYIIKSKKGRSNA